MIELEIDKRVFNPIYFKYAMENMHRTQIYYGGSSSGKSYAIVGQRTVLDLLGGDRNYLICRNTGTTIRGSCWNEVVAAINYFQVSDYFSVNKSSMEITCKLNGYQAFFKGLDDPEKIKSIRPKKGVLTDIIVEEATECSYTAVKQLMKRQRGRSRVPKRLTMLFNPILKEHWIYQNYFNIWDDSKQYAENPDLSILKTTYKDNHYLTKEDIYDLEHETDKYYYEVYTLGNWGILGAVIFKNWRVEDFSDIESTFDNYRYGVDWGFGSDPYAFVKAHYDKTRKRLYICDEIYATGLGNDETSDLVKPKLHDPEAMVTCDSAEPKSVRDYKKYHINAHKAKKGPGSIKYGIKWIQGLEVIIHPRCVNAKHEFTVYKYKEDKNNVALPIPVDKDNHLIDATRYATEDIMREEGLDVEELSGKGAMGTHKEEEVLGKGHRKGGRVF